MMKMKLNWIINTPRKKFAALRTIEIQGFEPGSSGSQTNTLTTMPYHLSYNYKYVQYVSTYSVTIQLKYICHGKFQTSLRIIRWSKFALNLLSYPFLNCSKLSQIKKDEEELNFITYGDLHPLINYKHVVYFDQHLVGAHSKCWSKYAFQHFLC